MVKTKWKRKYRLIEVLNIHDLPQPQTSWSEIIYLAYSFLAYRYWGSFDKTAEISDKVELVYKSSGNLDNCNLIELRTELFMIARGCQHRGDQPEGDSINYVHALVEAIRSKVIAENI